MLKVLAVLGWIILAVLILIIWIVIVPRSIFIEYTQDKSLVVKVRLFLFKIKVYPLNFSFKKNEKKENTKDENDTSQVDINKQTISQTQTYTQINTQNENQSQPDISKNQNTKTEKKIKTETKTVKEKSKEKNKIKEIFEYILDNKSIIKEALLTVKGALKILFDRIKIKDVSFIVPVCAENAHDVQKKYAAFTTAFYSLNIFLQKYINIYYKSPMFIADFANIYEDKEYFYCKIQASPSIIIVLGFYLFKQYNKIIKNNKSLKGEINYGRKTSTRIDGVSVGKNA